MTRFSELHRNDWDGDTHHLQPKKDSFGCFPLIEIKPDNTHQHNQTNKNSTVKQPTCVSECRGSLWNIHQAEELATDEQIRRFHQAAWQRINRMQKNTKR